MAAIVLKPWMLCPGKDQMRAFRLGGGHEALHSPQVLFTGVVLTSRLSPTPTWGKQLPGPESATLPCSASRVSPSRSPHVWSNPKKIAHAFRLRKRNSLPLKAGTFVALGEEAKLTRRWGGCVIRFLRRLPLSETVGFDPHFAKRLVSLAWFLWPSIEWHWTLASISFLFVVTYVPANVNSCLHGICAYQVDYKHRMA